MALTTEMGKYAESFGLQEKSVLGMDKEVMKGTLNSQFSNIAQQGLSSMQQTDNDMRNRGMEFSGAAQVKAPAMIKGQMGAQALGAINKQHQQNEQYKLSMGQMWMNVLQHEDSMEMQAKQMEMQEGDLLDVLGRVGSLMALI